MNQDSRIADEFLDELAEALRPTSLPAPLRRRVVAGWEAPAGVARRPLRRLAPRWLTTAIAASVALAFFRPTPSSQTLIGPAPLSADDAAAIVSSLRLMSWEGAADQDAVTLLEASVLDLGAALRGPADAGEPQQGRWKDGWDLPRQKSGSPPNDSIENKTGASGAHRAAPADGYRIASKLLSLRRFL